MKTIKLLVMTYTKKGIFTNDENEIANSTFSIEKVLFALLSILDCGHCYPLTSVFIPSL